MGKKCCASRQSTGRTLYGGCEAERLDTLELFRSQSAFGSHKCNSRPRQPEQGQHTELQLPQHVCNATTYFWMKEVKCSWKRLYSVTFVLFVLYKPVIVSGFIRHRQEQPAGTPSKKRQKTTSDFWNKPQLCKEFWMSASIDTSAELAARTVAVLEWVSRTSQ